MNDVYLGIYWTLPTFTIAVFGKKRSGYTLISTDTLTPGSQDPEAIGAFLKTWLEDRVPAKSKISAVVSVPESSVILQAITLPIAALANMDEAVYWEVTSRTAGISRDAIIDWKIVHKTPDSIDLTAFVYKTTEAKRITLALSRAGVALRAIEPSAISAIRALPPKSGDWLLIDLEDEESQNTIIRDSAPVFSSAITLPLNPSKLHENHLDAVTRDALVVASKKVLSYWEDKTGKKVSNVMVAGNGARLTGLPKGLQAAGRDNVPVTWKSIPQVSAHASDNVQTHFVQAMGAGVRSIFFDTTDDVNLLPTEDRTFLKDQLKATKTIYALQSFIFVGTIVMVVLAAVALIYQFFIASTRTRIAQKERFVTNHPAQKYVGDIQKTNTTLTAIKALMLAQKDESATLSLIASLVPKTVTLTGYKYIASPQKQAVIDGSGDRVSILAFYEALVAKSKASLVTMPYNSVSKDKNVDFHITIVW